MVVIVQLTSLKWSLQLFAERRAMVEKGEPFDTSHGPDGCPSTLNKADAPQKNAENESPRIQSCRLELSHPVLAVKLHFLPVFL